MRRLLPLSAGLLLAACAPASTRPAANPVTADPTSASTVSASTVSANMVSAAPVSAAPGDPTFRAAFAPEGVAWVSGGRACVARAPSYRVTCPNLRPAVDVGWNDGDAWAAVPGLGAVVTLDRAAQSVVVGRVTALSNTRVYREDGSAVTYAGADTRGVIGGPTAALTGGDGNDYVLLAGTLVRVPDGARLQEGAGPYLVATPAGAQSADLPAVATASSRYRLTGSQLERLDATGRVVARVAHGPGRVGLVGVDVVTVSPDGRVRTFGVDLRER